MKRFALGLSLLAAGAGAAEIARRDLQIAIGMRDPGFSYRLTSPLGSLTGEDAFTSDLTIRPGVRWAWARPGSGLAPLVGLDLQHEEAPLADGDGLRSDGAAAVAGATWAPLAGWAFDLEGHAGWSRATLRLDTADGAGLSGDGSATEIGLRLRALWTPAPRWSSGLEAGWARRTVAVGADHDRDLDLETSGWTAGLVVCWRPSARPTGLE